MKFAIACAVSDLETYGRRLSKSPDYADQRHTTITITDARSAADLNWFLDQNDKMVDAMRSDIFVYAHQDVLLPEGWLDSLERGWKAADSLFGQVALAGVYGVKTLSPDRRVRSVRAGHLLDRGKLLREPALLPRDVDSLDECVVAISAASGLRLDPALGWHFWATDLCLQAQDRGMVAVAVDAYCEHWSKTSRSYSFLPENYAVSREVFRKKWSHRLPVETPNERIEP